MTRILTGTADVTAGSATLVWNGDPLSAVNCPSDSPIVLDGDGYYVQSLTDTTHVVLTRNYSGTTATGIPAEISALTAAELQTATLNQRTATLLQSLAVPLTGLPMTFGGVIGTEADPGSGKITVDDADAPTVLRISKTASGGYGSLADVLSELDGSNNASARAYIELRPTDGAAASPILAVIGEVTDHTTYVTVPVRLDASTVPASGAKLAFSALLNGSDGELGNPRGAYASGTTYSLRDMVSDQQSSWIYINATSGAGHAPPTLPTEANTYCTDIANGTGRYVQGDGTDLDMNSSTVSYTGSFSPASPIPAVAA